MRHESHVALDERCRIRIESLEADGLRRCLPEVGPRDGAFLEYGGRRMLNLSANDYLGLAGDVRRTEAFLRAQAEAAGLGSSASRLLSGDHAAAAALERELAGAYGHGREALVFNSGYHANAGILPALAGRRDLVLVDKLAHASILDGVRLGDASWVRYRHGDMAHLAELLEAKRAAFDCVFIVTESVFSMDGDFADLPRLVELKHRYDAVLYVDEAHAVGVRGAHGLGLGEELDLLADIDILVGTFGKALASMGAYAVVSPVVKNCLVNSMRPLIYSTALPPVLVNWTRQVFGDMQSMSAERGRLAALADRFRAAVAVAGFERRGSAHIVPVVLGANAAAVDCAARLRDAGFLVFPIRPPTVPPGTARLRFSLSAAMVWRDVEPIPALLAQEAGA